MDSKRVILTTDYRGVFFGTLTALDEDKRIAVLEDVRNIIYWPADVQGFAGLATNGPLSGTRLGALTPRIKLWGVTSVLDCTAEAVAKFEAAK